jgi:hypothetical protein
MFAGSLVATLENESLLDFAGACSLSVARCEQSLANIPGELAALIRSSRLFLQAENFLNKLRYHSFEENIQVMSLISF